MKTRSVILRWMLYGLILFVLVFPKLQAKFELFETKPLSGGIVPADYVKPGVKTWFSGEYQEKKEKYISESFGFRSTLVRLNNQIAFSFFRKAKANEVVIGKDYYLYEKKYLDAYYGHDCIGADSVRIQMEKLRFIHSRLRKMNKELLLIFAAGKASYYPEFIPDDYRGKKMPTNYELYSAEAAVMKLPFIDFNREFVALKPTVKVPLFPKYGIHWSEYSSVMVADSILNRIGELLHVRMDSIVVTRTSYEKASDQDADIGNGMNLLFEFSEKQLHASITWLRRKEHKPNAVVVGDSYFWMPLNYGMGSAFNKFEFWYYNQEVHIDGNPVRKIRDEDIARAIGTTDVFVILSTEANLSRFGWGFVDAMYAYLKKNPVESKHATK